MTSLTCVFALERVTGIEPALSAREVCVAGHPPPDWLTCGSADTLPVRDRGCLLRLLSSGTQRARDLQIRRSGRIVHRCLRGGPIFQICRRVPVVGWRLGSSAGYSPGCVPTYAYERARASGTPYCGRVVCGRARRLAPRRPSARDHPGTCGCMALSVCHAMWRRSAPSQRKPTAPRTRSRMPPQ
jgi:hypothetical protein